MKIIFNPAISNDNKYVKIIVNSLKNRSFEVLDLKEVFKKPLLFFKVEIIHLNWFESLGGDSGFSVMLLFLKQYLKLLTFKLLNIKIIWTMHNKRPHEKSYSLLKKIIFKKVAKSSSAIIIHSLISKEILVNQLNICPNKIHFCPHPNYINEYGNIIVNKRKNEMDKIKLLFFGMIKPYKNIELLIDVVDEIKDLNIELKIIGKPVNEEYGNFLKEYKPNNKSIKIELGFVEDNMIPEFFSECDLLVLPLNIESSLNSGSVILAFSYKKSVICPNIGTIENLPNKNLVYSYSYETIKEHKQKLKGKIYDAYAAGNKKIEKCGQELYNFVQTEYSSDKIGNILNSIYHNVRNK